MWPLFSHIVCDDREFSPHKSWTNEESENLKERGNEEIIARYCNFEREVYEIFPH
jgi:hypothetical protein